MIESLTPIKYGFADGVNACCGTGPHNRGVYSCGGTEKVKDYQLCESSDPHLWWDSFHATERIHMEWNGTNWPYNLEDLFLNQEKPLAEIAYDPKYITNLANVLGQSHITDRRRENRVSLISTTKPSMGGTMDPEEINNQQEQEFVDFDCINTIMVEDENGWPRVKIV
ncbi:hypothetical protein RJ639_018479 [Escallonia herrerae]|uniref:Uncharacterized protein n=1 Tax=Escallonia herrerae TaxID=1293975 RepID=A0AA89AHR8_9ASTE|nr:hypothetical protein RJ639_018479 [Escallonia herrerae]